MNLHKPGTEQKTLNSELQWKAGQRMQRALVTSTRCLVFEGQLPADAESVPLLCFGKQEARGKVHVTGKEGRDKFTIRSNPSVVVLQQVMACEFVVFLPPLCSTANDDMALLILK